MLARPHAKAMLNAQQCSEENTYKIPKRYLNF